MAHGAVPRADCPEHVVRTAREVTRGMAEAYSSGCADAKPNAFPEGTNSAAQSIKRAGGGFRNLEYFRTTIFLRLGAPDFSAPVSPYCASH